MVKITVSMTKKALFRYFLSFTYKSFSGILGLLMGVGIFVLGCINIKGGENAYLYLIMGVFLVVYTPIMLWINSGKQLKRNFSRPLVYTLEESCILVELEGKQAEYQWKDMIKVTQSAGNVLIYTGYRNAFILPLESIGQQYEPMIAILKRCMGEEKIKIKNKQG